MLDFDFYNPTRIIFGKDRLESLDKHIPADAAVLIVSYGVKEMSALIDKVKDALSNRKVHEFVGIEPNPHYEILERGAEVIRNKNIDFMIAVGGGSVIDGTKFMSICSYYDGDSHELLYFDGAPFSLEVMDKIKKVVPFGTVLTLPATGSEMNNGSSISYNVYKYTVKSDLIFPKFSILDPTLTFTLPKTQIANGVVDAFVHVIEQYLTYPVDARVQDRMAEGILQTLIEVGETTIAEPENYDARANLIWSATLALNRLIGSGVPQDWASHWIGTDLTASFGIDHGKSVAVILPALLEVRREKKRAKLLQYAERVWHIDSGSEEEKIDLAIKMTRDFFERVGIKTHLSQYGIGADKIPEILDLLKAHGKTALSETKDLTLDISQKILERAL